VHSRFSFFPKRDLKGFPLVFNIGNYATVAIGVIISASSFLASLWSSSSLSSEEMPNGFEEFQLSSSGDSWLESLSSSQSNSVSSSSSYSSFSGRLRSSSLYSSTIDSMHYNWSTIGSYDLACASVTDSILKSLSMR